MNPNARTVVIVVLIVLFFFGLPTWGWHDYGWYPAGGLGGVLFLLLILWLLGII